MEQRYGQHKTNQHVYKVKLVEKAKMFIINKSEFYFSPQINRREKIKLSEFKRRYSTEYIVAKI